MAIRLAANTISLSGVLVACVAGVGACGSSGLQKTGRSGVDGAAGATGAAGTLDGPGGGSGSEGRGNGGAEPDGAAGTGGTTGGGRDGGFSDASGMAPKTAGGTRIRPRYFVLDDGSKVLFDLFDLTLGTSCTLRKDADGVVRCLPYRTLLAGYRYFSDASCTTAMALDVVVPVETRCSPATHLETADGYRAIGAPAASQPVYLFGDGECVVANDIPSPLEFRALGPLVPRTSLVEFHDEAKAIAPGLLDAIVKVGADGSRLWLGDMFDANLGVPVALRTANNGGSLDARALPIAPAERFNGGCCSLAPPAPCAMETGEGVACRAAPIRLSSGAPFVTDFATAEVFPIGAPFTAAYCGTPTAQGCVSNMVTPPTGKWMVGPALPPDDFLLAKLVPLGAGRYSTNMYVGAGVEFPTVVIYSPLYGGTLLDRWIVDTQAPTSNNACVLRKLDDGKFHCVVGSAETVFFLDPACTQPAAGDRAAYASYGVTQESYREVCALDAPYKLFAAGALINSGQPVPRYQFLGATGKCSPMSPQPARALGGPLDPSTLPPLTLLQD
jgi:hypothetical protein